MKLKNNLIGQKFKVQGGRGYYIYNGIDRIDSNKGYIIDNVTPCCGVCNYGKKEKSLEEFKSWIKKVYLRIVKDNNA